LSGCLASGAGKARPVCTRYSCTSFLCASPPPTRMGSRSYGSLRSQTEGAGEQKVWIRAGFVNLGLILPPFCCPSAHSQAYTDTQMCLMSPSMASAVAPSASPSVSVHTSSQTALCSCTTPCKLVFSLSPFPSSRCHSAMCSASSSSLAPLPAEPEGRKTWMESKVSTSTTRARVWSGRVKSRVRGRSARGISADLGVKRERGLGG
jgi:hypothetical protein